MRFAMLILGVLYLPFAVAGEVDGLTKKSSPYRVSETLDRLETVFKDKGITVALHWEHGRRAGEVDIPLHDTEVMIFGNPNIGSHLMTSAQRADIDLPMKALAWRDADGEVWLAYNNPVYIARWHGVDDRNEIIDKMSGALDALTSAAAASGR